MKSPLVTIIIPCYNSEKYIKRAIDSSLDQSYKNIEIVVIDDGSKDRSWDIITGFENIKKIKQENAGACTARNKGLEVSNGNYVKFLDSDDFLYDDCIKNQVESSNSLDMKEIAYGWHRILKEDEDRITDKKIDLHSDLSQPISLVLNNLLISLPLYPKSALLKVCGFDESLKSRQEWSLNIRLAIAGYSFSYFNDLTFCQRIHFSESRISSREMNCKDEFENLDAIYRSVKENAIPGFHDAWAWKLWNQGRQFLKKGDEVSAGHFFREAKRISPRKYKYYWPKTYRMATSVFGYKIPEVLKSKLR